MFQKQRSKTVEKIASLPEGKRVGCCAATFVVMTSILDDEGNVVLLGELKACLDIRHSGHGDVVGSHLALLAVADKWIHGVVWKIVVEGTAGACCLTACPFSLQLP